MDDHRHRLPPARRRVTYLQSVLRHAATQPGASAVVPRRALGLRGRLNLLAALSVLPLLVLTLVGDYLEYRIARDAAESHALGEARGIAADVGRMLQSEIAALQTLALSADLHEGRFDAFRPKALGFLTLRRTAAALRVIDPDGRAVFVAGGEPGRLNPNNMRLVFARTAPLVSGYRPDALDGRPGFCIQVPVLRDGRVAWDLELALDMTALAGVLATEREPDDWGRAIADTDGRVLLHIPATSLQPGSLLSARTIATMHAANASAIIPGHRADGTDLRLILATVPGLDGAGSPWHVVLGVPERALLAPLWRVTTISLLAGGVVMLGAFLLAGWVARGILQPILRLQALAAVPDAAQPLPPSGLPEADAVAAALHDAASARREAVARLQDLAATLEHRVTEEVAAREAAQAQAAQGERMQALGQLAGGIAHDFNNVLQTVSTAAHLLHKHSADPEAVERVARLLGNAGQHGTAITGRLLSFARRGGNGTGTPAPTPLAHVLAELRDLLAATLGTRVRLTLALPDDLPPVLVDRGQLETVLINLAVNARDAMPLGGELRLAVAPAVAPLPEGLATGHYLVLSVADTGIGMTPDQLARATEPFFTTKPAGRGTGLGLALARSFAEQSGGVLTIESAPGAGTTVRLWLRAAS